MRMFLVILVSCMLAYAAEPIKKVTPTKTAPVTKTVAPVKKVAPTNMITVIAKKASYEQQVKDVQAYYNQQMATIQKAKSNNEAIIAKINIDNQKLTVKEDSIKTVVKVKLQNLYDEETKKVQESQNTIEKRKADVDRIYKDATTELPK